MENSSRNNDSGRNNGFDKPRRHHYAFAHILLPKLIRSDPQIILQLLKEQGLGYLKMQWMELGLQLQNEGHELVPDGDVNTVGDFIKGKVAFNPKNHLTKYVEEISPDCYAIIIHLPEPKRRTEAYFVAIIAWYEGQNYVKHRYFTLELNDRENGSVVTVFCEWGEMGHRNYGEGSAPNKADFLQLIRQRLNLKNSVARSLGERPPTPDKTRLVFEELPDKGLLKLIQNPSPLNSEEHLRLAAAEFERRGLKSNFSDAEYKVITDGGRESGNMDASLIKELFLKKILTPETLVFVASHNQWLPLNKVFNVEIWTSSKPDNNSSIEENDSEFFEEGARVIPNSARRWTQVDDSPRRLALDSERHKTHVKSTLPQHFSDKKEQKEIALNAKADDSLTLFKDYQSPNVEEKRKMHGCLNAWLILMVFAGFIGAISLLSYPASVPLLLKIAASILTSVFALALLVWKRWGFYGFVITATIGFFINISIGINLITAAFFYLLGVIILFVLLHVGGEKKAWNQME